MNNTPAAPTAAAEDLTAFSDSKLYQRCQEYGLHARVWRRRFAGLLPEVLRRELHRRRGYASIYEFAFKLGGMSSSSVDKVLHLADRLVDKPTLREQLVSGSQGWSKIEKVAYIATPETEKEWAEKVEKMGANALAAYVEIQRRFSREQVGNSGQSTPGLFTKTGNDPIPTDIGLPDNNCKMEQAWGAMTFPVSPEVEKKLRMMKYQLEKEKGITLTFNEVFQVLMASEETDGAQEKTQLVIQVCPECVARKAAEAKSRAIPIGVRRLLQATYHGFCAFPTCAKPASSLHHTKRYSLAREHDYKSIVPLCTLHERLVHMGLIENEEAPPKEWRVVQRADPGHPKYAIDSRVQSYRRERTSAPSTPTTTPTTTT